MADDEEEKPDLRYTSREDRGVKLNRDLSGGGHLARGSSTRMSSLRFSVQAKPRDELDPELQALHDAPVAPPAPPAPAAPPAPPAVAPPPAQEQAASPEQTSGEEAAPGFLAAVKRLFS